MDNYEQKYKQALKEVQKLYKVMRIKSSTDALNTVTALEEIFPELSESEDEKIKKEIVRFIRMEVEDEIVGNKWLAWLEKQGEQKPFDYEHATITQKDFAPIEPKFKIGDWIVNNENGSVGQITNLIVDKSEYGYNHTNGWFHSVFEKDYHLWTIEDAKGGDVLADDNGFVMIVDESQDSEFGYRLSRHCSCSCSASNGEFFATNVHTKIEGLHPATEEQRGLLFQKMKEAGYEWDADKKELKKIEQKPIEWSKEEQNILEDIEEAVINYWHGDTVNTIISWLGSIKEKLT